MIAILNCGGNGSLLKKLLYFLIRVNNICHLKSSKYRLMESQLIWLNDKLNRKRIDYIEIQETCDKNCRIKQQFTDIMRYDDKYDYYITLISGLLSSLFPNVVKDKNDKFYYLENDILKTLTFTEGANELNNINANLQLKIQNESIKLVVDQGTVRCRILLKQRYKIDLHIMIHLEIYLDLMLVL